MLAMQHLGRFVGLAIALLYGASALCAQQAPPASQPPVQDNAPSPHAKNKPQSSAASVDRLQLAAPRGQDIETICNSMLSALGFVSSLSQTQITLAKKSPAVETPATYLLTDQTTGTGVVEKGAWVRVCYREADQKRTAVIIEVLEAAPAVTDTTAHKIKKDALPNLGGVNTRPVEDAPQLPSPSPGIAQKSHRTPSGPGGSETAGTRGTGDEGGNCAGTVLARGLVTSVSATALVLEENTTHGAEKSTYIRGPQTKEKGQIRPGIRAVICYSESAGKKTALSISASEPE